MVSGAIARSSTLGQGIDEATRLLARPDWRVIAGSVGYGAFDNAVLRACLHALAKRLRSRLF